jgi:hypothetical protein
MNDINFTTINSKEIEARKEIVENFLPHILAQLIEKGMIDDKRSSDTDYLWRIVEENIFDSDLISDPPVIFMFDDRFIEIARYAIETEKPEVGIVLIMVAVEHTLNRCYRDFLAKRGISGKDAREIIRMSGLAAKVGWLLKLSTGKELPKGLRKKILNLAEVRNSIVHYKATPVELIHADKTTKGWNTIKKRLNDLDMDCVLSTPSELKELLEKIYDSLDSNYQRAREMTHLMI